MNAPHIMTDGSEDSASIQFPPPRAASLCPPQNFIYLSELMKKPALGSRAFVSSAVLLLSFCSSALFGTERDIMERQWIAPPSLFRAIHNNVTAASLSSASRVVFPPCCSIFELALRLAPPRNDSEFLFVLGGSRLTTCCTFFTAIEVFSPILLVR